jgi:hypothetical protein
MKVRKSTVPRKTVLSTYAADYSGCLAFIEELVGLDIELVGRAWRATGVLRHEQRTWLGVGVVERIEGESRIEHG